MDITGPSDEPGVERSLDGLEQEVTVRCPHCGEPISVLADLSAGEQEFFEDCEVCCRPLLLRVHRRGGRAEVDVSGTG